MRSFRVNKYRNKKMRIGDRTFASQKEGKWYLIFKSQKDDGLIDDFECQVKYELIPKTDKFRGVSYFADFVVRQNDYSYSKKVYDIKSPITRKNPVYIIKKKLMYWRLGLEITEI